MDKRLDILRTLQTPSGLFLASAKHVSTGYNKAWLRDNIYISLAFEKAGEFETMTGIYHAILDILNKHEYKIRWAIEHKPTEAWQHIHARYDPYTLEEFTDPWGNKQNDAIGLILFKIAELEKQGHKILRNDQDRWMLALLVEYLYAIEYWHKPDNGMWEEHEEVHASSVGACVAGLKMVRDAGLVTVPPEMIEWGEYTLAELLPRESASRFCDMALLSLIYPYHLLDRDTENAVLKNVEYHLLKNNGVIRYRGDRYYNTDSHNWHEEAEWTMGYPWLSIIYAQRGEFHKAEKYLLSTEWLVHDGYLPELYLSNTNTPNENNPLGWAESLFIVAYIMFQDLLTG